MAQTSHPPCNGGELTVNPWLDPGMYTAFKHTLLVQIPQGSLWTQALKSAKATGRQQASLYRATVDKLPAGANQHQRQVTHTQCCTMNVIVGTHSAADQAGIPSQKLWLPGASLCQWSCLANLLICLPPGDHPIMLMLLLPSLPLQASLLIRQPPLNQSILLLNC